MDTTTMNPPYPSTAKGLTAALAALGATADHVADALTDAGHFGDRGDVAACPVARYLCAVIPTASDASVGNTDAVLWLVNDDAPLWPVDAAATGYVEVSLPAPVAAFVEAFDAGRYDDLARDEGDVDSDR